MLFRNPSPAEEKEKLKVCELLESDRLRLLMEQPFVGAILIRQNLIPVVDSRCPTACTDGQNIFVAPEFYLALPPAGRRFLLAHEVWHTVYLHFLRRNGRDVEYFNIATDMEINRMLVGERFKAPEGALLPPQEWRNLNAEEIYERLPKDQIPYRNFDTHLEKGNDDVSSGNVSEDNGAKPNGGGGRMMLPLMMCQAARMRFRSLTQITRSILAIIRKKVFVKKSWKLPHNMKNNGGNFRGILPKL